MRHLPNVHFKFSFHRQLHTVYCKAVDVYWTPDQYMFKVLVVVQQTGSNLSRGNSDVGGGYPTTTHELQYAE